MADELVNLVPMKRLSMAVEEGTTAEANPSSAPKIAYSDRRTSIQVGIQKFKHIFVGKEAEGALDIIFLFRQRNSFFFFIVITSFNCRFLQF